MALLNITGKKEVLGVDLGTSMIKILELKVSGDKISVVNFAQQDIGSLAIEEKSPEEKKQAYIDTLKQIISSCKFTTKNSAISISGSSIIVRFVKFPKMSAADLEKTLQFEAEPHIPFNIQEVDMDTQIIGDVEEESQVKMETVLVASKKDTIKEKVEIIEKAGLRPSIIDVDAFALENAYELINKNGSNKMILLVNIGASTTNISIVENGVSKVVRDLYVAGNNLTRAVQNSMQISMKEAEELKIKYGVSRGDAGSNNADESEDVNGQINNLLQPIVKELNSEIQRSIDYFTGQQTSRDVNIEKILLAGGTANLGGLADLVSAELRIPVEIFRPLENADISNIKDTQIDFTSPALAVVTGLAIRRIGDHG